ncbi:hypothetical protein [Aquiflexum sp.]|uniref:hypothetical protein n=1 Tax=Aquiflexum sp. TaxID=1872584 RepID=UPI0035943B98
MGSSFRKNTESLRFNTLIISILLFCFSCGRENTTESEIKSKLAYFLEKIDSIRIDRENKVMLLDFNPTIKRFLAFDQITEEFLILDDRGQILESIYRVGEGPNEYNSSILAASFNDKEGGYFMLSSNEFLWYTENWKVEKRIRFASHVQIRFYSGPKLKVPYYRLSSSSEPYFFTGFFSGINSFVGGDMKEFTSEYLIEQFKPQNEGLEWKLSNDTELIPDFELDKDNKEMKPVQIYSLDSEAKIMYLTFERSKEIGVYDLANDFELKGKMSFDHEIFNLSNKSKNTGLFNFGDDTFGVLYFMGLSEAGTEARKSNNSDYFPFSDPSLYRLIVVHNGNQQENEIEFPLKCEPHSEIIQVSENRILLRDKYMGSDEPDYSTYSIYELKSH